MLILDCFKGFLHNQIWPNTIQIWPSTIQIWPRAIQIWPSTIQIWPTLKMDIMKVGPSWDLITSVKRPFLIWDFSQNENIF